MTAGTRRYRLKKVIGTYFKGIIAYTILFAVLMLLILFVYVRGYEAMMQRTDSLSTFYYAIDVMIGSLEDFGFSEDADELENYRTYLEEAEENLEKLESAGIEGNYAINTANLRTLFDKFQENNEALVRYYAQDSSIAQESYLEIFEQSNELLNAMDRLEEILRQEINVANNDNKKQIDQAMNIILVLIMLEILTFCLLFWEISKRQMREILTPIEGLTREAMRIQTEPLEHFVMREKDVQNCNILEIGTLADAYQAMLDQIQAQIQMLQAHAQEKIQMQQRELEMLQIKKQLKEQEVQSLQTKNLLINSELRALQMHINPHFLFNTLNMIRQNAYLDHSDKTVYLLEEMAALLRYNLNNIGKLVTLQEEMEGLGHYICLQEERFGDRLSFMFELDEEYHHLKVPCFILQPLVENSIIHGMEGIDTVLTVKIQSRYLKERQCLELSIEDNGRGMDAEQLDAVRREMQGENRENTHSIGLSNVYQRLRLMTDIKAQMQLESVPGAGTVIRIVIACMPEAV